MRQITRVLAGSFLLTAFLATPVLAQPYPPDEPTAGVTRTVVVPCGTTTVTGSNWLAGSTVEITFDGEVIETGTVGSDGTFSTTVTIPCDTLPGTYVLGITGTAEDGSPQTVTMTITVVAAGGGAGAPGTGANLGAGILILAALLVVGVTALVATRRRVRVVPTQHVAE
jgi:hypothetical protein